MSRLSDLLQAVASRLERLPGRSGRAVDLPALFHAFQSVLANNNHALEIITDMGEKLSGSYIFDINYLKKSYGELAETLRTSVSEFSLLTGNRYSIDQAFDRIHALIAGMLDGERPADAGLLVFLADITWDRAREVGGKNYHLAELKNDLHLQVPDGFALTTRAFDEFLRHNALEERLETFRRNGVTGEQAAQIRDRILGGQFPPAFEKAVAGALDWMRRRYGEDALLAVRSSAEEEDDFFSFAGQFETVLNVPLETGAVLAAYKKVVASLFSAGALTYQQRLGYAFGSLKMAVGCLLLVDASASGVIYTADPARGRTDLVVINAAWGFGPSVVDGLTDVDVYTIRKGDPPQLADSRIGRKETMTILADPSGMRQASTPPELRRKPCLEAGEALALARQAQAIEAYFKTPQDIEWTRRGDGSFLMLQARPLRVEPRSGEEKAAADIGTVDAEHKALLKDQGIVVQAGVAAGKAFVLGKMDDLAKFPKGAVLVARNDSPHFIKVMPFASAIITDSGALASHMASVCREFKIPTIVNTQNATRLIPHGRLITVSGDEDGNCAVYDGLVGDLLKNRRQLGMRMEELYEFRRKKYILRYIAPLNLINPLEDDFTPEKCRTLHDVIRFMHEKSVQAIIDAARQGAGASALYSLDLAVPAGLQVVDLGDGVRSGSGRRISIEQIDSLPFRAVLEGMTHPGAWRPGGVPVEMKDFLSSMLRMPDLADGGEHFAGKNIAVVSKEYVNFALRCGYHFNLLDSYCSERAANNHIYFRFVGGATDITKRSRRIELIGLILKEFGFVSKTKSDLIIARVSHIGQEEVLKILNMAGRLIAYTRQLDALLRDDDHVQMYAARFLAGNYEV